ncbi:hypothetical protein MC885_016909 [Smutsia gigantea]|nr:hypothetical protein MC885_016909 [Smutsia gigantea]
MIGQTRKKLKEAAAEPLHSLRSMQSGRRRSATRAGVPEMEEEPQGKVEKPKKPLPVGGGLPGDARKCSPRRSRNLKAQNVQLEVGTRTLLPGRFHFLICLLDHLRDKVHLLRRLQFLSRTSLVIAAFVGILHW